MFYHDVLVSGITHLRNVKATGLKYNEDETIQSVTVYK